MLVSDIEIHVGKPDFSFTAVRRLEAKVEAATALSGAPTIDEANAKLREMATKLGANAVIEVEYNTGVSMTSWRSMKATGLAVIRESEEIACPVCAETIKRAAIKCRFCGNEIDKQALAETAPPKSILTPQAAALVDDPMRSTNNPQIWIWVGAGLFLFLMIVGMASG